MTLAIRVRTCPLCGNEANSPHHITPRAEGGGEEIGNVVYLCQKCHDEIEDKWYLFSNFLKFYAEKRERKVPAKWEEPKVKRIKLGPVGKPLPPEKETEVGEEKLPSEGTPSWLSRVLGVRRQVIMSILRDMYPRTETEKWAFWGPIPKEDWLKVAQRAIEKGEVISIPDNRLEGEVKAIADHPSILYQETKRRILRGRPSLRRYKDGEESPAYFGNEIGISGRMARQALRAFFPRPEEEKRSNWGSLTQEMQVKLKELVFKYNEDNKEHSKLHGKSWSSLLNSELNKIS